MPRELNLKIDVATNALRAKFKQIKLNANAALKSALHDSAQAVCKRAKTNHRFKNRTGNLERNIKSRARMDRGGGVAQVYVSNSKAPYAKYVHFGTRAHTIKARNARFLKFDWITPAGEKSTFIGKSVHNPGIGHRYRAYKQDDKMPDDFIYRANRQMRKEVDRIFKEHLRMALARVDNAHGNRGRSVNRAKKLMNR